MNESTRRPAAVNPWLRSALAFLIVVDLLVILIGLASIPVYVERAGNNTIETFQVGVNSPVSNEMIAAKAAARNMTPREYAVYDSAIALLFTGLVAAVGLLTLSRARSHWFGWFTAHIMLFLASWSLYTAIQAAHLAPRVWLGLSAVAWPLFILYFFLFPDGRAVPRWARWPVALYLPLHLAGQILAVVLSAFPAVADMIDVPVILGGLQGIILVIFPFLLGCQVYRYARVSTPTQRMQTKWFLFGFALFLSLTTITEAIWGADNVPLELATLPMALLPISLGIAILRHRLWDIDLVIRRTLVYAVVTALLALVFYGSVILLQRLFVAVSGQSSPVALVVSTLAIAALFSPLRSRVRSVVDRRFYRKKYDSQAVLGQFASVAWAETEMKALMEAFMLALRETVQPDHTNVWITDADPQWVASLRKGPLNERPAGYGEGEAGWAKLV